MDTLTVKRTIYSKKLPFKKDRTRREKYIDKDKYENKEICLRIFLPCKCIGSCKGERNYKFTSTKI
jgi:hypothetical protein